MLLVSVAWSGVEDRQEALDDRIAHHLIDAARSVDINGDDVRAEEIRRFSEPIELAAVRDPLVDRVRELLRGQRPVDPALSKQGFIVALVLVDEFPIDGKLEFSRKDGHARSSCHGGTDSTTGPMCPGTARSGDNREGILMVVYKSGCYHLTGGKIVWIREVK